jgi:hypothetical protein
MRFKYVRHSVAGFILWPADTDLFHVHVGQLADREAGGSVISAGFCLLAGGVRCGGKSESLGIGSSPDDPEALASQLGLKTYVEGSGLPQAKHSCDGADLFTTDQMIAYGNQRADRVIDALLGVK